MESFLLYIDAASGSLIVQVLIASVLAIPFFMRSQIARAVRAIRRTPGDAAPDGKPETPAS
jgi:hypothetical protein